MQHGVRYAGRSKLLLAHVSPERRAASVGSDRGQTTRRRRRRYTGVRSERRSGQGSRSSLHAELSSLAAPYASSVPDIA
eukprot:3052573-Rhodomonas_salina.4